MFGGDEILNTTQTTPWFDRQYLNDNKDLVSLAQHYTHKLYTLTCAACINTQWMPKLPMYAFLQVDFYGQQRFKATVAGGAHQSNGIIIIMIIITVYSNAMTLISNVHALIHDHLIITIYEVSIHSYSL